MLNPQLTAAVNAVGFSVRRPMEGPVSGQHRSPLHGLSPEFVDYRSYTPGDDLKNLDWRAHARSDRFYIKRYEEESNLRAFLIVDDSASMAYQPVGGSTSRSTSAPRLTKFEIATQVGVALASCLLKQRDAVGLLTASQDVRIVLRPSTSSGQLVQVVDQLTSNECTGETDLLAAMSAAVDQLPKRAVVIVLSDFLTELDGLEQLLGKFRYAGHELIACQILDRDEVDLPFQDSVIFKDIEGDDELYAEPWAFKQAYTEAMQAYRDDLKGRIQAAGYAYWPVISDDDLPKLIPKYLFERKR